VCQVDVTVTVGVVRLSASAAVLPVLPQHSITEWQCAITGKGDCINAYCKAWDATKQYAHGKMGPPPPWLIILEPQISAFCSSSD
jgi:hypothetical protein